MRPICGVIFLSGKGDGEMLSTQEIKRLWCDCCGETTRHETGFFDDPVSLGCALGFFTCGLGWLLVPIGVIVGREYVCTECGTKRRKQFFSSNG